MPCSSSVIQVATGESFSCALLTDLGGSVRCWGNNSFGQLGLGNTASLFAPSSLDILVGSSQITAGNYHVCALMTATGGVRCWGDNSYGQLGVGNTTLINVCGSSALPCLLTPYPKDILMDVEQIAAGHYHTCALMRVNKGVRCWGFNVLGDLGVTSQAENIWAPPNNDVVAGVAQISCGGFHTCALLTESGEVRCWGSNQQGQLGIGDLPGFLQGPLATSVMSGVVQISAGYRHTCAIMGGTGGVWCWGQNNYGQLGIGNISLAQLSTPYTQAVLEGALQISAGRYHTCALLAHSHAVRCWGSNVHGQLGIGAGPVDWCGASPCLISPPAVDVLNYTKYIAAGGFHTCAVSEIGELRCWGEDVYGQLGIGRSGIGLCGLNSSCVSTPPKINIAF